MSHLVWHVGHALHARGCSGIEEAVKAGAGCIEGLLLLLCCSCGHLLLASRQLLLLLQARKLHLQLHCLDLVHVLTLCTQDGLSKKFPSLAEESAVELCGDLYTQTSLMHEAGMKTYYVTWHRAAEAVQVL